MHFLALLLSVGIVTTIASSEKPPKLCRACQTLVNFVKVTKPDRKLWHTFCSDFHQEVTLRKEVLERIGTEKACRAFCQENTDTSNVQCER
ncbi:hypothetical protein PHET_07661 [Paragonimus heterotremus]|uniref:Saposin B-type domain-containing protein n=1 Tax=Paragonimus heterotremus TaxID=100268 RepID=A0A8J4T6K2_9TREM|nr:hypothetical protein PHET_07661 [Paragonimus heterotremus]